MGGDQRVEQPNVERPIFRNFKILNIESYEDELFDYFILVFFYICLNYSNTKNIWKFIKLAIHWILIVFRIVKFWKLDFLLKCKISEIRWFSRPWNLGHFCNFPKLNIFRIFQLRIFGIFQIEDFWNFPNCEFLKLSKLEN